MNSVNEQENCNTFLERDTVQHTVLVAQASKAGSQQEIKLQPMLHKLYTMVVSMYICKYVRTYMHAQYTY